MKKDFPTIRIAKTEDDTIWINTDDDLIGKEYAIDNNEEMNKQIISSLTKYFGC